MVDYKYYRLSNNYTNRLYLNNNNCENSDCYIRVYEKSGEKRINISSEIVAEYNSKHCHSCDKYTTNSTISTEIKKSYCDYYLLNPEKSIPVINEWLDKEEWIKMKPEYIARFPYALYWQKGLITDTVFIESTDFIPFLRLFFSRYFHVMSYDINNFYERKELCYGYQQKERWTIDQLKEIDKTKCCRAGYYEQFSSLEIRHPDISWMYPIDGGCYLAITNGDEPLNFPNVHDNGEICWGHVNVYDPADMPNTFWSSLFNKDLICKYDHFGYFLYDVGLDEFDDEYYDGKDGYYNTTLTSRDYIEILPNLAMRSFDCESFETRVKDDCDLFEHTYDIPNNAIGVLRVYSKELVNSYEQIFNNDLNEFVDTPTIWGYLIVYGEDSETYYCQLPNFDNDDVVNVVINKLTLINH